MSAEVIAAVGAALASLVAALTGTLTVILTRRAGARQKIAAKQGADIHTLVNSSMGAVLRTSAVQAKRLAMMTQDPEDLELAREAQEQLDAHSRQQAIVDRREENSAR